MVVHGTNGDDAITVSEAAGIVSVTVAGLKTVQMPSANVQSLVIDGGLGNDTLIVDSTTGPVLVPISYDGESGTDTLRLTGGVALGDSYTVGPQIGSGVSSISFAGGTQTVHFSNLEPVIDLVSAPSFNIIATNGDNAINYTAGNLGVANGLVTVDDHESIEFSNKTNLLIDALAGNDTINLNNSNTPTGLTGIAVTGGDPTASDTLIVNATAGADTITYSPTGAGTGGVGVSGLPGIDFATIEHLVINGRGGGDTLAVDSVDIDGTQVFTPGASIDAGTLDFQDNALANFIGTSLQFLGLGSGGTLTSSHGAPGGPRSDSFIYRGTDLSDDFTLTGLDASTGRINLGNRLPVDVSDMNEVTLAGLDGDDTFALQAGPNGLPFDGVTIDGGDPSASDVANLSGATGAVNVILGDASLSTNTVVSGYGAPVRFLGVEVGNLDANGNALSVSGTTAAESIQYSPSGPQSGTFTKSGLNTTFNFTNVAGAFTVIPTASGNSLAINGTAGDDAITVSQSGGTVSVAVGSFKPVQVPVADIQSLVIAGGAGNDVLTVDSTTGPVLVPITFDGEGGHDTLRLVGNSALSDTYTVGPKAGAGTSTAVFAGGTQTVHFQNLEPVVDLIVSPSLVVNGTNADNAITYTQGSVATNGLVAVDGFESIEFSNKSGLFLNGLGGNDSFSLNNSSTPTGLTSITVNGNDPTASDTLVVDGTTGADTITYTPVAAGQGTLAVAGLPTVSFATIEHLTVDGRGGNDSLSIDSASVTGTQVFTPGAAIDAGTIDFKDNSLANFIATSLTFLGLGQTGIVSTADGVAGGPRVDNFIYRGNDLSNEFELTGLNGFTGRINLDNRIPVDVSDMVGVTLAGLDGDDTFDVVAGPSGLPFDTLSIDGGDPSASDIVNLSGALGAVTVTLADATAGLPTTVQGYGAPVELTGVEIANLDANNNALTALGTTNDDVITYTPTGADTGTFTNEGLNTVFNFSAVAGAFTVDGGAGDSADELIVQGTNTRDTIQIDQDLRTVQVLSNNVTPLKLVTLANTMETLSVLGLAGQDTFQLIPAAGIGGFPLDNLLVNVDGGAGSNALVVGSTFAGAALPGSNFVVVNRDATPNTGTVRVYQNAVANPDVNYQSVQVVSPHVFDPSGTGIAPNLLVMGPDEYEPNESQGTAAFLGSNTSIQVEHAAIFPNGSEFPGVPADIDFYRIVAGVTGTLDLSVLFRTVAAGLLPGNGVLTLEVRDNLGNVVANGVANSDGLRTVVPVVAGKSYYVRVAGADGSVVNGYSLLAENFAAPVPTAVVLDPLDDSGSSNLDNDTYDVTDVHFLVHADLNALAAAGVTILTPAQAAAGLTPGAAVEVFVNGVSAGYATLVGGTGNTLFEINLDADLTKFSAGGPNAAGPLGYPGFTNLLTAAVRVFDVQEDGGGAPDPDNARGSQSVPEQVLFDNTDPLAPIDFALLASSDSGTPGDGITNVNPPAFGGRGEANTIVRIYADGALVGEGRVGSDDTDGVVGDGLGIWEVTIEPVTDGTYTFTSQLEDLAGNLSEASAELEITIDTSMPQRPTIDLLNNYDTGSSNLDNVTYFHELQFRVSAEPGSTVVIKDGNTVIDTFVMPAVDFTIRTLNLTNGPHPLSAEATDDAGNVSHQSEELLVEVDDTAPAPPSTPELLDASDSGVMGDGITNVDPPAFKGTGEANAKVRIYATLVGVPAPSRN